MVRLCIGTLLLSTKFFKQKLKGLNSLILKRSRSSQPDTPSPGELDCLRITLGFEDFHHDKLNQLFCDLFMPYLLYVGPLPPSTNNWKFDTNSD